MLLTEAAAVEVHRSANDIRRRFRLPLVAQHRLREIELGFVDQPGDIRRPLVDVVCGIAARRLRRVEDRLRPLALVFVPTHQAAGREGAAALSLCGGVTRAPIVFAVVLFDRYVPAR